MKLVWVWLGQGLHLGALEATVSELGPSHHRVQCWDVQQAELPAS